MRLPAKVFLEQIIDNIAFCECEWDDNSVKGKAKSQYLILDIINKKQEDNLNVGYYYDIELSGTITPYKICGNGNTRNEKLEESYVNLKINIDETKRQQKKVVENYRKIYLLSRFFSKVSVYTDNVKDIDEWKKSIESIKNFLNNNDDNNKKNKSFDISMRKLFHIIDENKKNASIFELFERVKDIDNLNTIFTELTMVPNMGNYYASLILHAVNKNRAMIYNDDCYKFLCDCSLLKNEGIKKEYQEYSKIICDRAKNINTATINKVGKEDSMQVSFNIKNFNYKDFLYEIL